MASFPVWHNMVRTFYRYERDEVVGVRVRARFGELEREPETDGEGYVELDAELSEPERSGLDRARFWHPVDLELVEPAEPAATKADGRWRGTSWCRRRERSGWW